MLKRLTVKNFALLSALEIEFGERLNILSGETGAGKSIIVDCIMLLKGGRYDKTMLRYGESSGFVEGVFEVSGSVKNDFNDYLDEDETEVVITRKFSVDGKNEIRINGRTATLSMLKAVTAHLIDICGQNEHQILANTANHIQIVDYYARHKIQQLITEIGEKYSRLREINNKLDEIGDASSRAMNLDIFKFQLREIDEAKVKDGEEDELVIRRKRFLGAEKICNALNAVVILLSENDDGETATELLSDANAELGRISSYDDRYQEWLDRLKSASIEIEDIAESVSDELSAFDFSQAELEKIEKRLDVIRNVTRKYGNYNAVQEYRKNLIEKIDSIENAEEYYDKLTKEKTALLKELYEQSVALSKERKDASVALQKSVEEELSQLGMENAVFSVKFEDLPALKDCEERLSAKGMDEVEFYLSANAGQPVQPLVKIISGGELSRLMLALKVVSSSIDETPSVIFDEIDTGISGKVGQVIAQKLARLASDRQLLCVTHLPQIASMADTHFFIDKVAKDGQTNTRVALLDKNGEIEEIARLSGGKDISSGATENAVQMKKWSNDYKKSL